MKDLDIIISAKQNIRNISNQENYYYDDEPSLTFGILR